MAGAFVARLVFFYQKLSQSAGLLRPSTIHINSNYQYHCSRVITVVSQFTALTDRGLVLLIIRDLGLETVAHALAISPDDPPSDKSPRLFLFLCVCLDSLGVYCVVFGY